MIMTSPSAREKVTSHTRPDSLVPFTTYLYLSGTSEPETKVPETCSGTPLKRAAFKRSQIPSLQNLQGVTVADRPQEGTLGRHGVHSQCSSKLKPIHVEFESLGLIVVIFLIAVINCPNKAT